jgi:hypothetical protein
MAKRTHDRLDFLLELRAVLEGVRESLSTVGVESAFLRECNRRIRHDPPANVGLDVFAKTRDDYPL